MLGLGIVGLVLRPVVCDRPGAVGYLIKERAIRHANMIFLIFFIVMWTIKPINDAFWKAVIWVTLSLGIDPLLILEGSDKFFFWR